MVTAQTHITDDVLADGLHALADLAARGLLRADGHTWYVEGKGRQHTCETVAWAMDIESTNAAPDIKGRMCRWWIGTLAGVPVRILTTVDGPELVWPTAEAVAAAVLTPDREVSP
jgi:hypothetical protein